MNTILIVINNLGADFVPHPVHCTLTQCLSIYVPVISVWSMSLLTLAHRYQA